MKGFLNLFGMSVGGWIGWALGAQISIFTAFIVSVVGTGVGLFYFTAFIVSVVGTGVGLFYTQRAVKRLLP